MCFETVGNEKIHFGQLMQLANAGLDLDGTDVVGVRVEHTQVGEQLRNAGEQFHFRFDG